MMERRVSEPRQSLYWRERVQGGLKDRFERIAEYANESHLRRYLLKCRECGQLYFFGFYEWVDWEKGNDPQYTKFIPVNSVDEGAELARLSPSELLGVSPRLATDFPDDVSKPTPYWFGKQE